MHNVYLYSGCYTLSPNADINWYTEKLGKRALLSEDDFVTYAADKKYSKNEKIACDLLYPAAKALDLGSASNTIAPEEIGISFGTAQGCIHSLQHAAENIKQKGHKGMMPRMQQTVFWAALLQRLPFDWASRTFALPITMQKMPDWMPFYLQATCCKTIPASML